MIKLLTLSIINQLYYNLMIMLFCTIHNTLPILLQNIFTPVKNIHEHNTRNSTQKYLN